MYPRTARFDQAIRAGGTMVAYCSAYLPGVGTPIVTDYPRTGGTLLPILGGAVTVDSTAKVRRNLSVNLTRLEGLYDLLSPTGVELRPSRGVRYTDGSEEVMPLGVFVVEQEGMDYTPDGQLQITAPDRYSRIQRARFATPTKSIKANLALAEIQRLAAGAFPSGFPGWARVDTPTHNPVVGVLTWDRDRDAAIEDLCASIGVRMYFDVNGYGVIANIPTNPGVPVWSVDASETGVQLSATRSRSRARTYSQVTAWGTKADGSTPVGRVTVRDNDTDSPTYYLGPFGAVTYFYSSPLIKSTSQATRAATTLLAKKKGLALQLTMSSVVHPGLDAEDTIEAVLLPDAGFSSGAERPAEVQIVESCTVPLTVDGEQDIGTRSTRPDTDDEAV